MIKAHLRKLSLLFLLIMMSCTFFVQASEPYLENEEIMPRAGYCSNCGEFGLDTFKISGPFVEYEKLPGACPYCARTGMVDKAITIEYWKTECRFCHIEATAKRTIGTSYHCNSCGKVWI